MFRRRAVLILLFMGLVPAFVGVNFVVTRARSKRQQLSVDWAAQASHDLASGQPEQAVQAYRTARQYAPDSDAYRLEMAEALLDAGHAAEAQGQLVTLLTSQPGDGVVNLELARAASMAGNVPDAIRYYHAAIDGEWEDNPAARRRNARLELARMLLARGMTAQAQIELTALSGDLPPDRTLMMDTAELLVKAKAETRALTVLDRVLQLNPHDGQAAQLAGEAAYSLGDYGAARMRLRTAEAAKALDARGAQMLDTSTRVLALDPYGPRISSRERIRRIIRAFGIASAALDACKSASLDDLRDQVKTASPGVTERKLARDPDAVDSTWMLVSNVVNAVNAACGEGAGDELALSLVLRQRRSTS